MTSTPQSASPAEELTFENIFEGLIILINVILEDRTRSVDKKNQYFTSPCFAFSKWKTSQATQAGYSARYQLLV